MRKFEMIEKGYEYATEGYSIKKSYVRKAVTNTGYSVLDKYGWVQEWRVYPVDENTIYVFRTLKEAKEFILKRDEEMKA